MDNSAIILAIRNILLTRKGNYPFNPSFGMNIQKYQFDILDDIQISEIKADLNRQIAEYLPAFQDVLVDVRIIDSADYVEADSRQMVGINVSTRVNGTPITTSFLLYQKNGSLNIVNETN